jgi:Cu+-exporting ATPase
MATDPVCGMSVDEKTAAGTSTHKGTTYYFCNASCKAKFDADPDRYAAAGGSGSKGA